MADTLYNVNTETEITPYIIGTSRTPSLTQVINVGLNGLVHIQNIGTVSYRVDVEFIIHKTKEAELLSAYQNGNLMKVVDDDNVYFGYLLSVKPDNKYAEGYCRCSVTLQQEVTL